jgi:transposase
MLDQLEISDEEWANASPAMRTAVSFLLKQNLVLRRDYSRVEHQLQQLQAQVDELKALRAEVIELRERLGQNSQNSSKPPSSDPPSAPRFQRREPTGRKTGGQTGHKGHGRKMVLLQEVDRVVELRPASCEGCGSLLLGEDPAPARRQVSELPRMKAEVTEYRRHTLVCQACGAPNQAPWPKEAAAGSFGPRAQAAVGYLTGRLGLSHRDVVEAMTTLHGLEIGLGSVAALQNQVSKALEGPVETACKFVQRQPSHYVDETGWPQGRKMDWLWIHATSEVTFFKIQPGRTTSAAQEILGKHFTGVVNTDRYNAYHWVDEEKRQLCWAHLKREFQAIKERGDESAEIGEGLLVEVGKLFRNWHDLREGQIDRLEFQGLMTPIKQRVSELLRAGSVCGQEKTQRTCRNILKLEGSLWTFVRVKGVEPTNNNAERGLRRAVLWRRKSFGTKSKSGSQFVERILTAVTTLRQQGRDVLDYLTSVCSSVNSQQDSICLLPDSS